MIAIRIVSADAMQDLPKGIDKTWRIKARECAKWAQDIMLEDGKCLRRILSALEEAAASQNFQEESLNEETDRT